MKLIEGDIIMGQIDGRFYVVDEILDNKYIVSTYRITQGAHRGEITFHDFETALSKKEFIITGNIFDGKKIDLSKSNVELK